MRANHYTTRASRNECSNVGACSLHATQVPNSCRKWHNIYILVLIHSPLYLSHTTLRWIVNVLSFPSNPTQIAVWAVPSLTFVLLSLAIIYSLNDRSSVWMLALYSRRSVTLKRVNGDATSAVCRLRIYIYISEALYAIPNCLYNMPRNACTQRSETKADVKSITCRRSVWGGVIQDVRSHKDLLCNVILYVGRTVCVAQ